MKQSAAARHNPRYDIRYNKKWRAWRRQQEAQAWVDCLYKLAVNCEGAMHAELMSKLAYCTDGGGHGEPFFDRKKQTWGLTWYKTSEKDVAIVPIARTDARLHPYFKELQNKIRYSEGPRTIFLPIVDDITAKWRGVVLYHELLHYEYHLQNKFRENEKAHWVEEYEVFCREIALVKHFYKQPYDQAAEELAASFKQKLSNNQFTLNSFDDVPDDVLHAALGECWSSIETGTKRALLILDALYRALDTLHPDGNKQEHHDITEWFYNTHPKVTW
ncbi:hypothetical protein JNJ66_02825 [Candidatus Saccharibacteria bacterium]|nr:hypothetical protein [Candidatus Saccharibacteria bacterium]